MISVRRSEDRGSANFGWLQSRHSFSFGSYYDADHMGVSALRVINDDQVTPGAGFPTHSHRDMEIISYVKHGVIEHKDSMGHVKSLPAGEFQLMTAGTGVTHSEYNASSTDPLEFLQIWIIPARQGIEPGYQQKRFPRDPGIQLIASPDARDESLLLHQDACLYQLLADPGQKLTYDLEPGRQLYIHVVVGDISIGSETLTEGDGATINELGLIELTATTASEALLFDLP